MPRDPQDGAPEGSRSSGLQGVLDWLFRSRETGRVVVGQTPNLPLQLWVVATVLGWLAQGRAGALPTVVATVGLTWWAADEVLRGVNPFRRVLGTGALVWVGLGLLGLR